MYRQHVGDHVLANCLAVAGQQIDSGLRQPAPVPERSETARNAVDLRAADVQPVVVELLAQPQVIGAALIEGEVDHRALRSQSLQRRMQAARMRPRLEHEVGAAAHGAVVPACLCVLPGMLLRHGGQAQLLRLLAAKLGRIGDDDLRRPVSAGK